MNILDVLSLFSIDDGIVDWVKGAIRLVFGKKLGKCRVTLWTHNCAGLNRQTHTHA